MITIEQVKKIAEDIKSDDGWVNDSHSASEHKGVVMGLDLLVKQLEEASEDDAQYEVTYKYARKCDVSGKGMNTGWIWGDGTFYTSTLEITLAECRKDREHILNAIKNVGCELNELDTIQNKEELGLLQDAIKRADKNEDTDQDLLYIGYHADYLFHTDWELDKDDDVYYLEDGTEVENL